MIFYKRGLNQNLLFGCLHSQNIFIDLKQRTNYKLSKIIGSFLHCNQKLNFRLLNIQVIDHFVINKNVIILSQT